MLKIFHKRDSAYDKKIRLMKKAKQKCNAVCSRLGKKGAILYGRPDIRDFYAIARKFEQQKDEAVRDSVIWDKVIKEHLWSVGILAPDLNP